MKIVLDTNVLFVSVSSKSPHHWIFQSILSGTIVLCVTYEILLEYHEKIEEHMGADVAEAVITVLINSPFVIEAVRYFILILLPAMKMIISFLIVRLPQMPMPSLLKTKILTC